MSVAARQAVQSSTITVSFAFRPASKARLRYSSRLQRHARQQVVAMSTAKLPTKQLLDVAVEAGEAAKQARSRSAAAYPSLAQPCACHCLAIHGGAVCVSWVQMTPGAA